MGKRFKLKLSLSSFQFCRSNDETCKPKSPLPSILLSPINPKSLDISFPCNSLLPDNPPPTPNASSKTTPLSSFNSSTHQKMYNSPVSVTHDDSENHSTEWPTTPPKGPKKNYTNENSSKRKCSVSSVDSAWFSSGEEESESLMSSSENFDSSSDFGVVVNHAVNTNNDSRSLSRRRRRKKTKKKSSSASVKVRRLRRYVSNSWKNGLTKMMMMSCTMEGRVNESFAVVKNSENPYEDFRGSMMEMILEKQMFEAKDLEQLLQCFLSLNSRHHHAAIVRAFSEIWEVLFP